MIGSSINGYRCIDEIGSGGFSEIYKVTKNGKYYAMKVVEKEMIYEQDLYKYILNEVQILQSIQNDHVIRLYNFFEDKDYFYFILELCEINTLLEYIVQEKPKLDRCVNILIQLLNGMRAIHKNRCLHRDMKLENILIKEGIFKIADFGLSSQNDEGESYIGTLRYMAPEILNENQGHNYKADFWSMGVIFFFMIYKCFPFNNRKHIYDEQKNKSVPFFDLKKVIKSLSNNKSQIKDLSNLDEDLQEFFKLIFVFDQKKRAPIKQFFTCKLLKKHMTKEQINQFIEAYTDLDQKLQIEQGKSQTVLFNKSSSLSQKNSQKTEEKLDTEIAPNKTAYTYKSPIKKINKYFIDIMGNVKEEEEFQQFELFLPSKQSESENKFGKKENMKISAQSEDSLNKLLKKQHEQLYADTDDLVSKFNKSGSNQNKKSAKLSQYSKKNLNYDDQQVQEEGLNSKLQFEDESVSFMNGEGVNGELEKQIEKEQNLNKIKNLKEIRTYDKLVSQHSRKQNDENLVEEDEITPNQLSEKIKEFILSSYKFKLQDQDDLEKWGPNYLKQSYSNLQGDNDSSPNITKSKQTKYTSTLKSGRTQTQQMETFGSLKSTMFKQNVREGILDDIFGDHKEVQKVYGFQIQKYLFQSDCMNMISKTIITPYAFSILVSVISKVIMYQISSLLTDLEEKKNVFKLQQGVFDEFVQSEYYEFLIEKLKSDRNKWALKNEQVNFRIQTSNLSKEVAAIINLQLNQDNYYNFFKFKIRDMFTTLYRSLFQVSIKSMESTVKKQRNLRGALYILLFLMTHHLKNKIPNYFFGNFKHDDNQEFELYNLWIQSLNESDLEAQIKSITKHTFGEKAMLFLMEDTMGDFLKKQKVLQQQQQIQQENQNQNQQKQEKVQQSN